MPPVADSLCHRERERRYVCLLRGYVCVCVRTCLYILLVSICNISYFVSPTRNARHKAKQNKAPRKKKKKKTHLRNWEKTERKEASKMPQRTPTPTDDDDNDTKIKRACAWARASPWTIWLIIWAPLNVRYLLVSYAVGFCFYIALNYLSVLRKLMNWMVWQATHVLVATAESLRSTCDKDYCT